MTANTVVNQSVFHFFKVKFLLYYFQEIGFKIIVVNMHTCFIDHALLQGVPYHWAHFLFAISSASRNV